MSAVNASTLNCYELKGFNRREAYMEFEMRSLDTAGGRLLVYKAKTGCVLWLNNIFVMVAVQLQGGFSPRVNCANVLHNVIANIS